MAALTAQVFTTPPFTGKIANEFKTAVIQTVRSTPTVTFTNGSAIIGGTFNTTNITRDSRVTLSTTGALPANFSTGVSYWVVSISSTQMQLSATRDGTAITAGAGQSGTHTATIDQYGQIWMVFVPTVSITCDRVSFWATATTGLNGTDTLRASIQTVTFTTRGFAESGRPSGTIVGTSATIASNLVNTTAGWNEITGLSATLTAGTPYALVIEPTAAWTATITARVTLNDTSTGNPYVIGSWQGGNLRENGLTGMPVLMYGSSGPTWYGFPCEALPSNLTVSNPSGGSGYIQTAINFVMPSSITSYKVDQVTLSNIRFQWGTSNVIYRIMDSTGTTTLQSTTLRDSAFTIYTQLHTQLTVQFEGTLATLTGGTTYLFVVEYQGGGIEQYVTQFNITYAGALYNTFAGLQNGTYISRQGTSGLWSTVPTAALMNPLSIRLSDVTLSGGSSGGMVVHPGMMGGIRG